MRKLDYKDRFIGLIGAEDIKLAKSITAGDESMEAIMKKMEDFSVNEEILGAYDAEEHRQFLEESIREQCREEGWEEGKQQGIEQGKQQGLEQGIEQGIQQGIEQGILNTAKNMKIEGADIDFISKVTGLSKEKIREL